MLNFSKTKEEQEGISMPVSPTLIGASVHCEGHLSGNTDVVIDGKFSGTIQIDGRLIIRPGGCICSEGVECRTADISGLAEGPFTIRETLHIREKGALTGDVSVAGIRIEEGGMFNGSCKTLSSGNSFVPGISPWPVSWNLWLKSPRLWLNRKKRKRNDKCKYK